MPHHIQMPPMLPYLLPIKPEAELRRPGAAGLKAWKAAQASGELEGDGTSSLTDVLDAEAVGLGGQSQRRGRGSGSSPRKAGPANKLLSEEALKTILAAQETAQE